MNSFRIATVLAILASAAVLGAGRANAAATTAARTDAVKDPEATGPEIRLKRGMPAVEVKKIMGEPQGVQLMPAPTGKAEVWTYRHRLPEVIEQVLVGMKPITYTQMAGDGKLHTTTIAEEPIYKMQRTVKTRVVSVLMFNDHFLEQKVRFEMERRFE